MRVLEEGPRTVGLVDLDTGRNRRSGEGGVGSDSEPGRSSGHTSEILQRRRETREGRGPLGPKTRHVHRREGDHTYYLLPSLSVSP